MDLQALSQFLEPGFTVQEALSILFEEDGTQNLPVRDIFIAPPDPAELTDEDSGDEEAGHPDNLCGNQLTADAEIRTLNGNIFPLPETYTKYVGERTWINGDLVDFQRSFPNFSYDQFKNMSEVLIFELFFDDSIFELLVQETNRYALQKTGNNLSFTKEEMKCFFGILILSGYCKLPNKRMYWENNEDTHNSLVSNSMRRNRFEQILKNFHVANNENFTTEDKLWKIRPLIENLKDRFIKYFVPQQCLSFDESMVKYFGKNSMKQFIRGKPIRFGYKSWSLNTIDGYLINFEIYQGKSIQKNDNIEKVFGKAAAPLVKIINNFPRAIQQLPFKFYFDNYFTSFELLNFLRERGFGGTGTIRENRIPKDCPLEGNKKIKKLERGKFLHTLSREDAVIICKWADNSCVSVVSNCHGINEITQVRRFSQKGKKYVNISRPNIIREYNKNMGGTDRMDQHVNNYRIRIRNRKWYWPLITWLIDVAINNAWLLCRRSGKNIPQLQFRRIIAQTYLQKYATIPKGPGRPSGEGSLHGRVQNELRYDGINHLVKKIPNEKRRRCAGRLCASSTRTMCSKCNIGLCVDCFIDYHIIKV